MKKFLILFLFPIFAYGAIPQTAEGWYTPENGFLSERTPKTATYKQGGKDCSCKYDPMEDTFVWTSHAVPSEPGKTAMETALRAYVVADINSEAIETLGENLHALYSKDGITITGETPDGKTHSYTIKFTNGLNGDDNTIQATTSHMRWNLADGKSLRLLDGNKIEINGWNGAPMATISNEEDLRKYKPKLLSWHKSSEAPVYIPSDLFLNNASQLNFDSRTFTTNGQSKGRLELRGMQQVQDLVGASSTTGGEAVIPNFWNGWALGYNLLSDFFNDELFLADIDESNNKRITIKGWQDADDFAFPMKSPEAVGLAWHTPKSLLGDSLEWTEQDKIEVKGANKYAGKQEKRYFGTGLDSSLGWHELPNVTTNIVQGDERTISSQFKTVNGSEIKELELKGWNSSYSGAMPLFLVNNNGVLDYQPLPEASTNGTPCGCSNKWESTIAWLEDGLISEDGKDVEFENENLTSYLKSKSFLTVKNNNVDFDGKTEFEFKVDNYGFNVTAPFKFPDNWADDSSIDYHGGYASIYGWHEQSPCNAKLSQILTDPNDTENRRKHQILTRYGDTGGKIHYLPIGDLIETSRVKVDESSITSNSVGEVLITGFDSASDDEFPIKRNGKIEWVPTNAVQRVESMGNFRYDPTTREIAEGAVCIGRKYYKVAGLNVGTYTGGVRVKVNLEEKTATLELGDGFADPGYKISYIPVYSMSGGQISADYRGAGTVQCYEDLSE